MGAYSIAGVDLTVEEIREPGGYRCGEPRRYRVSNCEWVAEFTLRHDGTAPQASVLALEPRFGHGNRCKFAADLSLMESLFNQVLAPSSGVRLVGPCAH